MKPWRERIASGVVVSPEKAARYDREDALTLEAIRLFVSEAAAWQWALRPTGALGGWQSPTQCAGGSPEGLERALAYLRSLNIQPLPPDPPDPWKGKKKAFRRAR
jgi:uncharacterized protein (DUF2384 family)